jgi:hypothetical protein
MPKNIDDIDEMKKTINEQITACGVAFPIRNKRDLANIYPFGTPMKCRVQGKERSIHDIINDLDDRDFPLNNLVQRLLREKQVTQARLLRAAGNAVLRRSADVRIDQDNTFAALADEPRELVQRGGLSLSGCRRAKPLRSISPRCRPTLRLRSRIRKRCKRCAEP